MTQRLVTLKCNSQTLIINQALDSLLSSLNFNIARPKRCILFCGPGHAAIKLISSYSHDVAHDLASMQHAMCIVGNPTIHAASELQLAAAFQTATHMARRSGHAWLSCPPDMHVQGQQGLQPVTFSNPNVLNVDNYQVVQCKWLKYVSILIASID